MGMMMQMMMMMMMAMMMMMMMMMTMMMMMMMMRVRMRKSFTFSAPQESHSGELVGQFSSRQSLYFWPMSMMKPLMVLVTYFLIFSSSVSSSRLLMCSSIVSLSSFSIVSMLK